jgi:hypothetical protein
MQFLAVNPLVQPRRPALPQQDRAYGHRVINGYTPRIDQKSKDAAAPCGDFGRRSKRDIKGDYGYVAPNKYSTDGTEIFDARTHTSVGAIGSSEDLLEIDFANGKITQVGDQYGIGRR